MRRTTLSLLISSTLGIVTSLLIATNSSAVSHPKPNADTIPIGNPATPLFPSEKEGWKEKDLAKSKGKIVLGTKPITVPLHPSNVENGLQLQAEYEMVVTKLPFKVVYNGSADTYTWDIPHSWVAKAVDNELTVTGAANGKATVTLKTFKILWKQEKTERKTHTLTVSVGKATGPTTPAPPDIVPPPSPNGTFFFMVVRADGPADPTFTRLMSDPSWDTLKRNGHFVKDYTLSKARALNAKIVVGTKLPAVVGLEKQSDGKYKQLKVVPAPTSPEEIIALPTAIKE